MAVLQRLAAAVDALPKQAMLGGWARAWAELAGQLGIVDESGEACRRQDFGILLDSLAEGDRLAALLGWEPVVLDRRQALAALMDTARNVRSRCPPDESGRVRVLAAPSVRAVQVPYLFFAGLAEKSFPMPEPQNRLYSRAEEERLVRAGLPLSAAGLRHSEEMLLFYEVLTRATRRLCFSYPAMDESGQPLSPSPYLEELEQVCGPGRIRRTVVPDLSPIPAHDDPLTAEEFRVKAVAASLDGDVSLLAGLVRGDAGLAGDNLLAGLRTTHAREDRNAFGPMEGMIDGDAARRQLAARYSAEAAFSATELERYAACPFRFLMEHVLRLRPLDDLTLETDYRARGQRFHEVLSAFHQRVNRACGGPASPASLDEAEYQRILDETLNDVFGPGELAPLARAFREIDRKLLVEWTAEYRQQHAAYDGLWPQCQRPLSPAWFEVSFGMECHEPPSTERPLELDTSAGLVRIVGRIDRIDLGMIGGRTVFNVLDYKTSATAKFNPQGVAEGTCLQLPLYALATEKLLLAGQEALAWQAGYWPLLAGGYKPKQALTVRDSEESLLAPLAEWEAIREAAVRSVGAIVACLREGRFPVYNADEHCTRNCSYNTLCRINQIRSLEKTWQLPVQG
jgi:ATP-dependent helicase/nuclease subunit B